MLTTEEKDFIHYWENNRLRRKKIFRQFLVGIPIGLLFVIPIVINFASGWYKRAQMESNSQDFNPMVLFFALLLIIVFIAIFYQQHRWDRYEQRYRELLARQADPPPATDPSLATAHPPPAPGIAPSGSPASQEPTNPSLPGQPVDLPPKTDEN